MFVCFLEGLIQRVPTIMCLCLMRSSRGWAPTSHQSTLDCTLSISCHWQTERAIRSTSLNPPSSVPTVYIPSDHCHQHRCAVTEYPASLSHVQNWRETIAVRPFSLIFSLNQSIDRFEIRFAPTMDVAAQPPWSSLRDLLLGLIYPLDLGDVTRWLEGVPKTCWNQGGELITPRKPMIWLCGMRYPMIPPSFPGLISLD